MKNNPNLETLRHSTAHVLAAAVKKLYPGVKFGIGPAIESGFYYDFDFGNQKISDDDLPKIEKEMEKIIAQKLPFVKKEISVGEARELFKDQPYKLELIEELSANNDLRITIYELGDFVDLCKGPHVKDTSEIKAFKLTHLAGAYWKGSEKNPMLTRIYGTAFPTQKELDEYLKLQEEAKRRDHRKIGKELGLFLFDNEVGPGLPLWLPKGAILRNEVINFAFNTYLKRGYIPVSTPHIASIELWKHSGHWDFYKEGMYAPFGVDEAQYTLKPMNCPFHVKIYNSKIRSYRELPIRYTEMGTVYRYERSGVLHGLTRVRGFTQDDAHIICRSDQLHEELLEILNLTEYVLNTFGFEDLHFHLSVRDPKTPKKYLGSDADWRLAEKALEEVLKEKGYQDVQRDEGEAVFYGPKIDLKIADAIKREWQLSTIQVDFNLPQRFSMKYIGQDGKQHQPFMIHRALLGSIERFIGILTEHYAGAFPVWLAPVQVVVIPISDRHFEYAQKVANDLRFTNYDLRVTLDTRDETMQAKIRDAQLQKIPYMLIVGDEEMQEAKSKKQKFVSVRLRTGEDLGEMNIETFKNRLRDRILTKSLQL